MGGFDRQRSALRHGITRIDDEVGQDLFKLRLICTEPGVGRVESDIPATAIPEPLAQPQGGTETILLVEDDPSVRTLVRDELRKLGYRVVEAKNGVDACLLATQRAGSFQLLLTDVVMPGMGGREVAQHLSAIKPDLRTLFMSGYLDDIGIMEGQEEGMSSFLQKPFTPEMLARTVRNLLDSSSVSEATGASSSSASPQIPH